MKLKTNGMNVQNCNCSSLRNQIKVKNSDKGEDSRIQTIYHAYKIKARNKN